MSVHSQQIFVQASYQAAYAVPRSTRTPVMWGILGSTDKSHNCKIIFTLQRDSLLPLWSSNSNSNTFCNAGIRALTRPHQLENASSPLQSAVRIFASFDLTSRKSYCFAFPRISRCHTKWNIFHWSDHDWTCHNDSSGNVQRLPHRGRFCPLLRSTPPLLLIK